MNELDHIQVELAGRNLIEASAGTGKTYAIASLYLRLLMEKELTPEQILVVTYTEAATKELRGRIRNRIREALALFSGGTTTDPLLTSLAANSNGKGPTREQARERLSRALTAFDTASIFTIHGFCLRALKENAFESGSLYDTELVTDQSVLLREIADDFWRIRFFARPAPLLGYALRRKFSASFFLEFLSGMLGNPKLKIVPNYSQDDIAAMEAGCETAFQSVRLEWRQQRQQIILLLQNDKGLSRGPYKIDLLPGLLAELDSFTTGNNPFDLGAGFAKVTASGIAQGTKPTGTAPDHPFFHSCEALQRRVEERFLALQWELIVFARDRLKARKKETNIRFFDDLLNDLYGALCGESGGALASRLSEKYRAALIDEFQDTDPVQYDIFRRIYDNPDSPLFLIGDPKQAIYSFRGADIFAYLEAAADVAGENRFTLTGNWRSTPRLLTALNMLFAHEGRPFVFDALAYHPVTPGPTKAGKELTLTGSDDAPLQLWYLPPDQEGKTLSVGKANDAVVAGVAGEIARLLRQGERGEALVGERPLLPEDIAVIVRSHRQAGAIQGALKSLMIPSVMRSDLSIFATEEARELCTLLSALVYPGSEPRVRAALVTSILGRSGTDLAELNENESAWENCLEQFRDYHQSWLDKGFMVMSQSLLSREGVRGRLLRRPDGERRLTNLLHCLEIIHQAAHDRRLGMEGLITWFGERVSGGEAGEEYQIRLETDAKLVKIVTVHVSKGLEYPIVFCPFMWGGLRGNDRVITFHDSFSMMKDFGSPGYERHRLLAQKESLAESLRLLYVALTRAKYRCYLSAGKVHDSSEKNRPETSPLAYLLHGTEETKTAADLVTQLAAQVSIIPRQEMEQQLEELAERSGGTIAANRMPDPAGAPPYLPNAAYTGPPAMKEFTGTIATDWRVTSFTSFATHQSPAAEEPDRDDTGSTPAVPLPGEAPPGKSIYTFPRGAQAGIFLHDLFEDLDFAAGSPAAIRSLVEKGLESHGYDPEWLPHICAMVTNVITVPLASPEGPFTLAGLQPGNWIKELEFFFPLKFITSDTLRNCLRNHAGGYDATELHRVATALKFKSVRGMVHGFMDLVFTHNGRYYLLDWKSNHLGYQSREYGRDLLGSAMSRHLYPLQYLLYTVALDRYLTGRLPGYDYDSHFGGVLYVFLRGVSADQGEEFGIFRDLPPLALIRELTECLLETGGEGCDHGN